MTSLRQQLVCEKALASYVRQLKLNQFLKLGTGEEKTGGRNRDAVIADMFEALLGALYLDQGMDAVSVILDAVILPRLVNCSGTAWFDDIRIEPVE
jgi:ribonuclease-3